MKTRNKMKKLEQEKFVIPKTVQNVIPIKAVYKDGIFLVGKNMYSKTFLFTDVNYYIACESEKNDLMRQYWAVINSFGNGVTVKLTINNHRFDKEEFEKSILMPYYYDNLDVYRKEYNEMLLNKAATSESIVQDKYFTVTVNKKCYEDARAFFTRIEKNLSTNLFALGSKCEPLNATDRLKIFHNFYRAGSEENFNLDFELLQNQGCDVRDYISPDAMDFNSDYMMINGQYCRTVFLRNYGTFVDDNIITELTSINKNLMLSIDFIPIPVDEANKDVDNILLGVQSDKANFNRRQAQNQNYGATNYDLEQREKEILEIRNDMRYRDQRIYDTIISMVITADSKQELDNLTESIFAKASENSTAQFATLRYQQLDGLNTVLPFGVKRIECYRTLTTESLASFMPFHAQEVSHSGGAYYGQNAISNNMIFVNRHSLLNGNSIVLGVPGGGKSFMVKEDIVSIFLSNPDADIVIIDPEREYNALVKAFGGEVINISANSPNHINAMDMNANYEDEGNPVTTKSEFIMSLCEQLLGTSADAKDKSIIDRCCKNVYDGYIKNNYSTQQPTLKDFREELLKQKETEAHDLALAIELFTDGSLNTFAQPTNVDINNRLISYDILELGDSLLPVGMLIVLDNLLNKITSNREKRRQTYIFIDEMYLLFAHQYTAKFLYRIWKRVRKYGAFAIGITQNVGDMLESNTARTMVSNSEFVIMLNQKASDVLELSRLLEITPNQTQYFTNKDAGQGLMKIGSNLVPFVNKFPKDTQLYKLMTSKPGEAI